MLILAKSGDETRQTKKILVGEKSR